MKCTVCGKRFNPKKTQRYEVSPETDVGILESLFKSETTKIIECFDCPRCGCQNAVNTRIPKLPDKSYDDGDTECVDTTLRS